MCGLEVFFFFFVRSKLASEILDIAIGKTSNKIPINIKGGGVGVGDFFTCIDKVIQWCLGLNSTIEGSNKANTCFIAWKLSFLKQWASKRVLHRVCLY